MLEERGGGDGAGGGFGGFAVGSVNLESFGVLRRRKKRGFVRKRWARGRRKGTNAFCLNASATPAPQLPLALQASVVGGVGF